MGSCLCFAFCSCHAYHIMSSCASHLHTCSSHASEHFPRCLFCNPALRSPPVHPSCFLSCACVKISRNGPRLVKWPWYTTCRPPVKFRAIWRSFDTPTVNRVTAEASFLFAAQHPFQSGPKPRKLPSELSVVRSRSCGRKPHLFWTLLAPSTYK